MPIQQEISKQLNPATGNYLVIYLSILQFTEMWIVHDGTCTSNHLTIKKTWNLMMKTFLAGN